MRFLFSLPSRRLSYVKIVQGERNEKKKGSITNRMGNIAFNDMYKLQFICLIGGAGYKPAPQLGRFKYSFGSGMHTFPYIYFTFPIFIFHVSFLLYNSLIIILFCG